MHLSYGAKSCFLIIHILNSSSTQGVADVGCLPFVLPRIPPNLHGCDILFTSMAGNISFHSSFWWKVSLQLSPVLTASLPFPLHLIPVHSGYCNSWFQWWPEQKATRGEGLNFPGFSIKVLVPFSLFEVDFIPLQPWEQELWGSLEDGYGQIEEIWAKQGEAG